MKLKEKKDNIVYLEASVEDKTALLAFIEASIRDFNTYTINICNFGTSMNNLEQMLHVVSGQFEDDRSMKMSVHLFGQMGCVAKAWKRYGFEHVFPENHYKLEADKDTVYALSEIFDECFYS